MYEIRHYQKYATSDEGRDVYMDWLEKLSDTTAKIAIVRRVARMEISNFGEYKFCRDGVWELRIDVGAGLPRVLRNRREKDCFAAVRRRQTNAGCRH